MLLSLKNALVILTYLLAVLTNNLRHALIWSLSFTFTMDFIVFNPIMSGVDT